MGPENRLIQAVHKLLRGKAHCEKMHNVYRGGTADAWYSPKGRKDLWIEYKWLPRTPKTGRVTPDLSGLQLDWLTGRHAEGRSIHVAVGHPGGVVLLSEPRQWKDGVPAALFTKMTITRRQLADWITAP
jgi:hypothetical protein